MASGTSSSDPENIKSSIDPLPIRLTKYICLCSGLPLFASDKRERISRWISKIYYLSFLMGLLHAVLVAAAFPKKREDAIFIMMLLIVAFGICFYLRKNISMIEQVFCGVQQYLSENDMMYIRNKDLIMNLASVTTSVISVVVAVTAITLFRDAFREEMRSIGVAYSISDAAVVLLSFCCFIYYMNVVCGLITCSIQVYSITMIVFTCLARNVRTTIRSALAAGPNVQSISQIRAQLRIYWNWKLKTDQLLNVFPFIWLLYLFLTISLIFTKLIVDWHKADEGSPFLIICAALAVLVIGSLLSKWHLFMRPDWTMDECMRLAFQLTDPLITGKMDAALNQEIHSLHLELGNAPKTYATILGIVRLNFKSLISYVTALVNFAAIVINIRHAIKV